jgi:hypothetical protein
LYLKVTDTDGATNGNLNITMSNPNPVVNGGFISANNGATISGWPSVITAVASGDWGFTTTWSPAVVPTSGVPVVIPSGITPFLSAPQTVGDITLQGTGGITIGSTYSLTSNGNLTMSASSAITCADSLMVLTGTAKTITGTAGMSLCGVKIVGGSYSLAGGYLPMGVVRIQNGGTLTVAGNYTTMQSLDTRGPVSGGVLVMQNAADSVVVTGTTHLGSVNTSGLMTAGSLVARGDIFTDTGFVASGTHKVWVASGDATQHIGMNPQSSASGYHDLIFDGGGSKLLDVGQGNYALNVSGRLVARSGSAQVLNGANLYSGSSTIWVHGGAVYDSSATSDRFQFSSMYVSSPTAMPKSLSVGFLDFENAPYTLTDSLHVNGFVEVNGPSAVLTLGGHTLRTAGGNGFATTSLGTLVMSSSLDTLDVSGGTAFQGGDETGKLTNGVLHLGGTFTQSSVSSATSFVGSGSHKTVAVGSASYTLASPTTSTFNDFTISAGTTVSLASDMTIKGTLGFAGSLAATFTATSTRTITASGLNLPGPYPVNFTNVALSYVDGVSGATTFNNGSFGGFGALFTGNMLSMNRTSGSPPTFSSLQFAGTLSYGVGKYINNIGSVALTLVSPTPSSTAAPSICGCTGTNYRSATGVSWP